MPRPDVSVINHGSLVLFWLQTPKAREWFRRGGADRGLILLEDRVTLQAQDADKLRQRLAGEGMVIDVP